MKDIFRQAHNLGIFVRTITGAIRHRDGRLPWPLFVDADDMGRARAALDAASIPSWGWGYHAGRVFCQVPKSRAYEAECSLVDADIEVYGRRLTQ